MFGASMLDVTQVSGSAMLTAKAYTVLGAASRGRQLNTVQINILGRAAELVKRMVEGSLLVSRRTVTGFSPSYRGLEEYARALSALRALNRSSEGPEVFVQYRDQLLSVAKGEKLTEQELDDLKLFFSALSNYFDSTPVPPGGDTPPDLER